MLMIISFLRTELTFPNLPYINRVDTILMPELFGMLNTFPM
jgi:hypothetical protein